MRVTKRTLVNVSGEHRKFWTVEVLGRNVICSWGRIGNSPQAKMFKFRSEAAALDFAERRLYSKLMRGYSW